MEQLWLNEKIRTPSRLDARGEVSEAKLKQKQHAGTSTKDGRNEQRKNYFQAYHQQNRIQRIAYSKIYNRKNRALIDLRIALWRKRNPERYAAIKRAGTLKRYGLSNAEYDAMHSAQSGCCAICGKQETFKYPRTGKLKQLAVDHNHITGQVRGLLCNQCNLALGKWENSPEWFRRVALYLEKYIRQWEYKRLSIQL